MLTIVHGDDITASRNYLLSALEGKTYIALNSKKNEEDLDLAFSNNELFLEEKIVFIDGLSSFKGTLYKKCLDYVMQNDANSAINVYVWDSKTIDKRVLAKFQKAKVHVFALPKHFFTFLDNFIPKNAAKLHELLFKLYPGLAAEQILYALINRTRLLIMIQNPGEYEEIQKLAPFQKSKVMSQARQWQTPKVELFYKKLFDTEVGLKTSTLPMSLINHIDFLIVSELH